MTTPKRPSPSSPGRRQPPVSGRPSRTSAPRPSSSARPSGKPSNGRKRNIHRKSRYYRQRRQKLILLTGIAGAVLLLLLIALLVRSCGGSRTDNVKDANSDNAVSMVVSDKNTVSEDTTEPGPEESDSLPPAPVTLTVSVVGDCTLGTDENFDYSTSLNSYFENYGPEYFFSNVKSIFESDDLTIANNEGTFTTSDQREDKQFAFKASTDFAKIYSSSSVEAVNTANNHSRDYGEQSFTDTMKALDSEGIVHFGYDETQVMDVKGVKVGLVGIYELRDHLERTQQLKDNIAKVKTEGAQLVIVIFHWGNEKETVPDDNQMTLGRLAIDEGADLVCGHHPHVLQGIETYKGKNIVYSLGNFCFGGNSYPSDMDSMIFQQTFTIDANGVQADNITNVIPCSISSEYGYNNYQPTPATGDEKTRIQNKIDERSSWIPAAQTVSPPA